MFGLAEEADCLSFGRHWNGGNPENYLMRLNLGTLAVTTIAILAFVTFTLRSPWTPWRIAGLAIVVPASVLFVAARLQLGRSFSVQAKATKLVTTGIYARIRNPIYVFGGLMLAGVLIWAHRPWWLLVLALLIPAQMVRARREARVLEGAFGPEYREYRRKTWF